MRDRDKIVEALEFLIQHERLMYKIARQYVGSKLDCEDIVQDSFANILRRFDTLADLSNNQRLAYIAAVVRNRSLNFIKRKQLEERIIVVSVDDETYQKAESLAQMTKPQMPITHSPIKEAIDSLSDVDRYLIEGKYIIGLSDAELAQELNCQPASIRTKLTNARRRLLTEMEKLGETYER